MLKAIQFGFAVVLTVILCSALPGYAQSKSTWLPVFDAKQHVYVDPSLGTAASSSNFKSLDALEQPLIEEGKKHNLSIYVVATNRGSESIGNSRYPEWGPAKLSELELLWSGQPGFDQPHSLIIMWVVDNSMLGFGNSVAATAGDKVAGQIVDLDRTVRYTVYQNGIDPSRAVQEIVAQVGSDIDSYPARQKQDKEFNAEFGAVLTFLVVGLTCVLLICAPVEAVRGWIGDYQSANGTAKSKIDSYRASFRERSNKLVDLNRRYANLLTGVGDRSKVEGATLAAYQSLELTVKTLSKEIDAANQRVQEAERCVSRCVFPLSGGLWKAVGLMNNTAIEIASVEPESGEDRLLSETPKTVTVSNLSQLQTDMDAHQESAEQALSGLVQTTRTVDADKQELSVAMLDIVELKDKLIARELSLDTYRSRLTEINTRIDTVVSAVATDPVSHQSELSRLKNIILALKADMEHELSSAPEASRQEVVERP